MIGVPLACVACGGTMPADASPAQLSPKAPGDARAGEAARCPVSGETFVAREDSPKVVYEGKTYYFCCADCAARFQADPRHYLEQMSRASRATY